MIPKIEDILDECLERRFGGESIDDCLAAYPEQASQLEPLVEAGWACRRNCAAIRPDAEFKARAEYELQAAFYANREEVARTVIIPIWRRGWAMAMAALLVVFVGGLGTAAASANAVPDEFLYPVKLAAEQVRVTLTWSDVDQARLHVEFAERRAYEMVEVARQGKADKVSMLADQVTRHLGEMCLRDRTEEAAEEGSKALAPMPAASGADAYSEGKGTEGLEAFLSQSRAESVQALADALAKAPEALKPIIARAMENVAEDYDRTIFIIQNTSGQ